MRVNLILGGDMEERLTVSFLRINHINRIITDVGKKRKK